jgi:hypothetical protein
MIETNAIEYERQKETWKEWYWTVYKTFEVETFYRVNCGVLPVKNMNQECGDPFRPLFFLRTSVGEVHFELRSIKKRADVRNEKYRILGMKVVQKFVTKKYMMLVT